MQVSAAATQVPALVNESKQHFWPCWHRHLVCLPSIDFATHIALLCLLAASAPNPIGTASTIANVNKATQRVMMLAPSKEANEQGQVYSQQAALTLAKATFLAGVGNWKHHLLQCAEMQQHPRRPLLRILTASLRTLEGTTSHLAASNHWPQWGTKAP
jgi:hypothetical protein